MASRFFRPMRSLIKLRNPLPALLPRPILLRKLTSRDYFLIPKFFPRTTLFFATSTLLNTPISPKSISLYISYITDDEEKIDCLNRMRFVDLKALYADNSQCPIHLPISNFSKLRDDVIRVSVYNKECTNALIEHIPYCKECANAFIDYISKNNDIDMLARFAKSKNQYDEYFFLRALLYYSDKGLGNKLRSLIIMNIKSADPEFIRIMTRASDMFHKQFLQYLVENKDLDCFEKNIHWMV